MHIIRIYAVHRNNDGLYREPHFVTSFHALNRHLYDEAKHNFPEGPHFIWLR